MVGGVRSVGLFARVVEGVEVIKFTEYLFKVCFFAVAVLVCAFIIIFISFRPKVNCLRICGGLSTDYDFENGVAFVCVCMCVFDSDKF